MSQRRCACGCKRSLEGMRSGARYASAACRTRDWKSREGITGIRYVKASQNAKSKSSGLQVSALKMQKVMERRLYEFGYSRLVAKQRAFEDVYAALPPRQRERFAGSSTVGERKAA
jgi:hypothetical protein